MGHASRTKRERRNNRSNTRRPVMPPSAPLLGPDGQLQGYVIVDATGRATFVPAKEQ